MRFRRRFARPRAWGTRERTCSRATCTGAWPSRAIALLVLAFTFASTCPALAEGLKLEDAVHLALQSNERAQKATLRVDIADAQVERARDAFLPSLSGSAGSTYKIDPAARTTNPTYSGAITLTQPLLSP